jgi:Protein of unknown function (DUF3106)
VRASKSILAILVLVFSTMPALALFPRWQKSGPSKTANQPPRNVAAPANSQSSANSYQFQPKGPGPHRGDWLRKYGNLPPSEQEQQLKQDPSFRSLSPDKQNQLLDRLRNFNSQPPEKKQQILNRMETFEHLTPEQQASARNLFQRYHNLPEDQRAKVSQAYRRLRGMPPEARNQLMNSDEFRNNFTEEQRDLLRGMTDLNLTPSR